MGDFSGVFMVKQYVAVVRSCRCRFRVFTTGDPRYYLFDRLMEETSISSGCPFPVLKADLSPAIRRALAHGWGNSL